MLELGFRWFFIDKAAPVADPKGGDRAVAGTIL